MTSAPLNTAREVGAQYLCFVLGEETYAVDVLRVQEIRSYSTITPIPHAPPHLKGVINLRGTVVPVMGLRERFGMPPVPYDPFKVIVIVAVGTKIAGIVVDAVTDVVTLNTADIEASPVLAGDADGSFIQRFAKSGDRLTIILDVERTLAAAFGGETKPKCPERGAPTLPPFSGEHT
jgi:purine-binding chemotaxis protein CheW